MGCRNCGDKASKRYKPTIVVKNVDQETVPAMEQGTFAAKRVPAPPVERVSGLKDDDEAFEGAQPAHPHIERPPVQPEQMSLQEAFESAKSLTVDELMGRLADFQQTQDREIERAFSEMTHPMRLFHVLNLLSIANYENLSSPGISPEQAVVGLKTALDRKDFSEVNKLYPTLRAKVDARYEQLVANKIRLD